jgi:hypothetical protein
MESVTVERFIEGVSNEKGTNRAQGAAGLSLCPLPAWPGRPGSTDYAKEPLSMSSRRAALCLATFLCVKKLYVEREIEIMPVKVSTQIRGPYPTPTFNLTNIVATELRANLPYGLPYVRDDTFSTNIEGTPAMVRFAFDVDNVNVAKKYLQALGIKIPEPERARLYLTQARFTTYGSTHISVRFDEYVKGPFELLEERRESQQRAHSALSLEIQEYIYRGESPPQELLRKLLAHIGHFPAPSMPTDEDFARLAETMAPVLCSAIKAVNNILAGHAFLMKDKNVTRVTPGDFASYAVTQYGELGQLYRYEVFFGHGGMGEFGPGPTYDSEIKKQIENISNIVSQLPSYIDLFWASREYIAQSDLRTALYLLVVGFEDYVTNVLRLNGTSSADLENLSGLAKKCGKGFKDIGFHSCQKESFWTKPLTEMFDLIRSLRNSIAHEGSTRFEVNVTVHDIRSPSDARQWYAKCVGLIREVDSRLRSEGLATPPGIDYI